MIICTIGLGQVAKTLLLRGITQIQFFLRLRSIAGATVRTHPIIARIRGPNPFLLDLK